MARRSLVMLPEADNLSCVSHVKGLAGDALRRLGRRSEASALIEEAVDEAERRAMRWGLPETLRALARCLLDVDGGDASGAEAALRRATVLARRQGSLLMEHRAATDFAELMFEQGARDAAREAVEGLLGALSASAPTGDRERAEAVFRASS